MSEPTGPDGRLPMVGIQPVDSPTDPERILTAIEDMIERSDVLRREGVVLSLEAAPTPRSRSGRESGTDGREEIYCPECGWTEPEWQVGEPPLCSGCGIEYPFPGKVRVRSAEPVGDGSSNREGST